MKFPPSPIVTVLAYRPNYLVTQLGNVELNEDSSFKFYSIRLYDREAIVAKIAEIAADDLRQRRQTSARRPLHAIVLLANGELPQGDLKHDLDVLMRQALAKASELVAEEERASNLAKLQAERERLQRDAAFTRDRDFQALKTLLGKYSLQELREAGVLADIE